jgi:protein involved in sex pheromone biosynthesis
MALAGLCLTLTACGRLKNSDLANNATNSTQKTRKYQTTNTGSNSYTVLLKNGHYLTSPIAGLTATDNDNSVDTRELERGLVQISKDQYPTSSNVFQEGQQLSSATVTDWLAKKSKSNPDGLNPANQGKKRTPYYLEEINEQDYLAGSGSNYHLTGISLGLAMNSVDYYTSGNIQKSVNISRAAQARYGKQMANEIIARLRRRKSLKKVPITIGLFSKTSKDSLVGGTYFADGTADANSSKITKWKSLSQRTQVLPTINGAKAYNSSDASAFNDFKTAVQNYFPNISGVTANLRYEDGKLQQENISITTQFYGYEQIKGFTQLVLSSAKKYLPNNVAMEIKIGSVDDVQALVAKETNDSDYQVHIYGGE